MPESLFGPGPVPWWRKRRSYASYYIPVAVLIFLCWLFFTTGSLSPPYSDFRPPQLQRGAADQVTLILNTFKREDLLRASVLHYSQCQVVNRIHVNWAESVTPPNLASATCCNKRITYQLPLATHNDTSLNTRFLPIDDLDTDAVLNIDDDITVSCAVLEETLSAWHKHPEQLVGWFPRLTTTTRSGAARYLSQQDTLLWHAEYDTILTKSAIMHKRYLRAYSEDMPSYLRDMVKARRNCEDLTMQHLVSNLTGTAPYFVWDPYVRDAGAGFVPSVPGISNDSSHFRTRSDCVTQLRAEFGSLPRRRLSEHSWRPLLQLSPIIDTLISGFVPTGAQRHCVCPLQQL